MVQHGNAVLAKVELDDAAAAAAVLARALAALNPLSCMFLKILMDLTVVGI